MTRDAVPTACAASPAQASRRALVFSANIRAVKSSGGSTTVYVYAGHRPIAEYVNGTLSTEYVYAGTRLIAEYDSGTLYYHHSDHLSVRQTTNSSGQVVGEQGHYPFGESWYSTNTTSKYHLTNYARDSESGNDYAQHCYHVNRLSRFSNVDPKAGCPKNPQNLNRYSYVGNDPINRTDPRGLIWRDGCGGGGGDDDSGYGDMSSSGCGCENYEAPDCGFGCNPLLMCCDTFACENFVQAPVPVQVGVPIITCNQPHKRPEEIQCYIFWRSNTSDTCDYFFACFSSLGLGTTAVLRTDIASACGMPSVSRCPKVGVSIFGVDEEGFFTLGLRVNYEKRYLSP